MATTYEIIARVPEERGSETISKKELRASETEKIKQTEEIASPDLSRGFKKTVATAALIYSVSQIAVNPIMREMSNRASVSGDYVQAENIARTQARVNQGVSLGLEALGIVAATMINPALGGVALLSSVSKHTQQAISRNQANRALEGKNNIDNYINSFESSRFINVKAGR